MSVDHCLRAGSRTGGDGSTRLAVKFSRERTDVTRPGRDRESFGKRMG